jgi:hypothetical protein
MDALVRVALVGTAIVGAGGRTETKTPVDTLLPPLGTAEPERQVLLRAGALAIYRQAGYIPPRALPVIEPHAPETLPECPPQVDALIGQLFSDAHHDLLPQALERLCAAGWRLPSSRLVQALNRTAAEERGALVPVLGERGHWLARFHPSWRWATAAHMQDELSANAETIWQEGTRRERVETLRHLRATRPALARAWLETVWRQEKADMRAELLSSFDAGLSPEDEPFLERALDDRAERVRTAAVSLLMGLPGSQLAARMCARAEQLLVLAEGALDVKLPTAFDQSWLRDGVTETPPTGLGERAWWLTQIVRQVRPSHWTRHFGATPEELLAALVGSKWRMQMAECWTDAAQRFGDRKWAGPLWQFWRAATDKEIKPARVSRAELLGQLFPFLSEEERETYVLARIAEPEIKGEPDLDEVLGLLPAPWSDAVSAAFLAGLRLFVVTLTPQSQTGEPWEDALAAAALALPPRFFSTALEPLPLPEVPAGKRANVPYLRNWLESFAETIRLRQRLQEEIPS